MEHSRRGPVTDWIQTPGPCATLGDCFSVVIDIVLIQITIHISVHTYVAHNIHYSSQLGCEHRCEWWCKVLFKVYFAKEKLRSVHPWGLTMQVFYWLLPTYYHAWSGIIKGLADRIKTRCPCRILHDPAEGEIHFGSVPSVPSAPYYTLWFLIMSGTEVRCICFPHFTIIVCIQCSSLLHDPVCNTYLYPWALTRRQ